VGAVREEQLEGRIDPPLNSLLKAFPSSHQGEILCCVLLYFGQ
jgi:hypothetical protein